LTRSLSCRSADESEADFLPFSAHKLSKTWLSASFKQDRSKEIWASTEI